MHASWLTCHCISGQGYVKATANVEMVTDLIAKGVNRLVLGLLWHEVRGASELFSRQVESYPGLWWLSTYMFCRVCLLGIGTIKWLCRNVCYRIMAENSPIIKPSWGNSGLKAHFFRS